MKQSYCHKKIIVMTQLVLVLFAASGGTTSHVASFCSAFTAVGPPPYRLPHRTTTTKASKGCRTACPQHCCQQNPRNIPNNNHEPISLAWWKQLFRRLDTVQSSGYEHPATVRGAGLFGAKSLLSKGKKVIKKIHDPITYFTLGILAGFKWDWCFKSPIYWFAIGFTIKWYRARYVYKTPVWDRQPNWNNIITSKDQEKDLKAYTCKVCGSTIFIAKTREFFFEGDTGIGGLGCFSCGAKGKENFVMDRDRIVEDVGDMDDYFDYERPLDFVSRAERRKLLKAAQGDEDRANEILLQRKAATTSTTVTTETSPDSTDTVVSENEGAASSSVDSPSKSKLEGDEGSSAAAVVPPIEALGENYDDGNDDATMETTAASVDNTSVEIEPTASSNLSTTEEILVSDDNLPDGMVAVDSSTVEEASHIEIEQQEASDAPSVHEVQQIDAGPTPSSLIESEPHQGDEVHSDLPVEEEERSVNVVQQSQRKPVVTATSAAPPPKAKSSVATALSSKSRVIDLDGLDELDMDA